MSHTATKRIPRPARPDQEHPRRKIDHLCGLHAGNGASLKLPELLAEARGDGRVEDRPAEGAVIELHLSVPYLLAVQLMYCISK